MTNDTREQTGLFSGDTGASAETTDGEIQRVGGSEMSDRAPVGTATATEATADLSGEDRTEEIQQMRQDNEDAVRGAKDANRDIEDAARQGGETQTDAEKTQPPNIDDSPRFEADSDDTASLNSTGNPTEGRFGERLRAVERAITGTDDTVADLGDEAAATAERDALSARLDELESRVTELEAATQALRGYVGSIRSVNQAVERRADLALAEARKHGDNATSGGVSPDDRGGSADKQTAKTNDNTNDSAVPGDDALDAALPAERRGENETRAPTGDRVDDGDERPSDGSWGPAALERLRESI